METPLQRTGPTIRPASALPVGSQPGQVPTPASSPALILALTLALICALISSGADPLSAQELRYTRPIDVPEPGWVRVPVDPEILRRAAPAGGHLLLFGPDGEEVAFRRVASEEQAERDRALSVTVSRPECQIGQEPSIGPRTVCSLPLGFAGRLLHRLQLTVAATDPVGYRLLVPEEGRWEPVAQGVWSSPLPETPHELELDLGLPDPAEPLRLELYGGDRPELVRASAEMGFEALLFEARRAGRHTLAYGPVVFRSSRSEGVHPPPGAEPARVQPGPEEAGDTAAVVRPLPESAGPAPSVRFERRWRVTAEAPEPGTVHRLALEPAVYAATRSGLGDLRLLAGDLQVPYVSWRPNAPAVVTALRDVQPSAVPGLEGRVRLEIDPGVPEVPLSALVVHGGAGRIRTRIRVLTAGAAVPGEEPEVARLTPWQDWTCSRQAPLSCRLVVDLTGRWTPEAAVEPGGEQGGRLLLELDGSGAGADPGPLDVDLLRHRDVVLFAWPSGERPLELAAGAADLEAPTYDLGDRYDEILARPWLRAGLAAGEEELEDGRVGRWTVAVTLAIALVTLLLLLDRVLARREPAGS